MISLRQRLSLDADLRLPKAWLPTLADLANNPDVTPETVTDLAQTLAQQALTLKIINIDCLAGAGTLALGHNHPDVLQSIQSVITSGLPLHTLDSMTPLKDEFSSYLLSLLPGEGKEYCLQFTGPSGADAVEAAIKLAKKATGRSGVIKPGGYHGMTSRRVVRDR